MVDNRNYLRGFIGALVQEHAFHAQGGETSLNYQLLLNRAVGARARLPARLRALEQDPAAARAHQRLKDLVQDYLTLEEPEKALDAIDRFGPRLSIQPWELDSLRLCPAEKLGSGVALISQRLISSAAPDTLRARAMLAWGRAEASAKNLVEARRILSRMIYFFSGSQDDDVLPQLVRVAQAEIERLR